MANEYYTLVTAAGRALEVQAKANNVPLKLTRMAVGDGNGSEYSPSGAETKLKRERWRGNLNTLSAHPDHPNWLIAEAVLPDEVGGWWIREVGLFASTGVLYAIAKYPPTYKPVLADGADKMLYLRMIFEVTNTASVTLQVDPSIVLATRTYVDERHDTLHRSQAALAAAQVDTMRRQIAHDDQLADSNGTLHQSLTALAAEQDHVAQRQAEHARQMLYRREEIDRTLTAVAAAQVQTMHRQVVHDAQLHDGHETLSQSLTALAAEQDHAARRQAEHARQMLYRREEIDRTLTAMAAAQIQTMARQLEHEYRLPAKP